MNFIIIIGLTTFILLCGVLFNVLRIKKRKKRKKKKITKAFTIKFKTLRIGVIGAGAMGTFLSSLVERTGAKIVVVHDIKREAAEKLANERKEAVATTELNKLFDTPMDGLLVCTIPTARIEPIKRACEKNIHLFIEKPPAHDLVGGRECLYAIKKSGIIAAVGFQLRYDSRYELLKQLIKGHDVHMARTVFTIGHYLDFQVSPWFLQKKVSRGPIADSAIHLLDCVRYIFDNSRPTLAAAIGVKNMAPDHTEFDTENALQLMYKLDNGVIGVHTNHCGHEKLHFDLELIGPHLRLKANMTDPTISGIIKGKEINEFPPKVNKLGGLDKVEAWIKAIDTGNRGYIRSDYAESLNTQALVDAAIKSQTTHCVEIAEKV